MLLWGLWSRADITFPSWWIRSVHLAERIKHKRSLFQLTMESKPAVYVRSIYFISSVRRHEDMMCEFSSTFNVFIRQKQTKTFSSDHFHLILFIADIMTSKVILRGLETLFVIVLVTWFCPERTSLLSVPLNSRSFYWIFLFHCYFVLAQFSALLQIEMFFKNNIFTN